MTNTEPRKPTVIITEVTQDLIEDIFHKTGDYPEEGSSFCDLCGETIGIELVGDEDRPQWRTYFEIVTRWTPGHTDTSKFCEDSFDYLQTIAPAVLAKDTGYYV